MSINYIDTGDKKLDALIEAMADAVFACGEWEDEQQGPYNDFLERSRKARQELSRYLRERLHPTVNGDA